mmetsp:Transcript_7202/g.21134  ORF Transcript_7202/g.21134 Transcript_7202/m.21134 type:complete len:320 (+) Transcript_7202:237-1196(+)
MPMLRCALVVAAAQALTLLESARLRTGCEARAAFAAEVAAERPDNLRVAIAVAAEERPEDRLDATASRVDAGIDDICARASARASLEGMLGNAGGGSRAVARAVGAAMYGAAGLPDETGTDVSYFSGDSDGYYDPRNSFVDKVVERRRGIPLTMSLVYARACAAAGAPFDLINTPGHVLVRPADGDFAVDAFGGGAILDGFPAADLRGVPALSGLNFAARLLRNLRLIYERSEADETARLLGAAERMLLVADRDARFEAVPPAERVHCRAAVGLCLFKLQDEDRRDECRELLESAARDAGENGKHFRELLADKFFCASS